MDRLAVVTGTSRGLGAACARELVRRDWRVLGISRGPAAEGLEHGLYTHQELDLADINALERWFESDFLEHHAPERATRLGLVNNAGVLAPLKPIHALPAQELERAFMVNSVAPIWLLGFFLRLAGERPLRVLDLSSGAAQSPYPGWGAYCATKAALAMADRVFGVEREEAPELQGRDVAVVSYSPHVVATRMQEQIRAAALEDFPRRERFEALHADGELVAPEAPASQMADLLEADDLPATSACRFVP